MRSTVMLSIVSGSLIDKRIPSVVWTFGGAVKDFRRFSVCISGSLWIGLFIYLFLRKVLAGVAKRIRDVRGHIRSRRTADGTSRERVSERQRKTESRPQLTER